MKNTKLTSVKLIRSILPISLPTVRSWIFQNKLPVVRLGRKVFVRKVVIEKIGMVRIFRSSLSIPNLRNHVKLNGSLYCWIGNFGCSELYYRAGDYKGKPLFRRRGNPKDTIRCKFLFFVFYAYLLLTYENLIFFLIIKASYINTIISINIFTRYNRTI